VSEKSAIEVILGQTRVEPRPYQTRIVNKVVSMFLGTHKNAAEELEPAARSVMIESPTGSGKTVMGLLVAKTLQQITGVRIGWVAMRRNLLQQAEAENATKGIGVDPIEFISMFEKKPPTDIDLLILDESHHDAASSMAHLHNVIRPRWILGLTATPYRSDRVSLCFDRTVKDCGIHRLIGDRFLSEFDHYTIPKWDVQQLADLYCSEPERWGKSVFFFHTIGQCFALQQLLQQRGIVCDVVTGDSDRETQLEAFRTGSVSVVINCMVLTEGFDDPTLKTVWVRPSGRGPTIQMAGRALRKCPGLAAKQIVQCKQTRHPFPKTARPRQQFLWQPDGWRSLSLNPKIELCSRNVCRVIAQTVVQLPPLLLKKEVRSRPRRIRI
jgi:superfamily II DNA or RNA helicase